MAACLQLLASAWTLNLKTECVDLKRSAKHDLSLPKVRQSYLDRIAAKEFDAILLSPPCASFSRATWANFRGPGPVRSYECPRGLQTLTPAERDRAIMGNIFADLEGVPRPPLPTITFATEIAKPLRQAVSLACKQRLQS